MNCGGPAFLFGHKHPDDPRERVNITSGSFSIPGTQTLKEHEALARKSSAAFSNAYSSAEYV